MDDKIFNLLEKMYVEVQEMKEKMVTKEELNNVKGDINSINHSIVRIEDKLDNNHKALYDGYKQSIESITDIKGKIEKLTDKVENQEIKLQVLKSIK